VAEKDILIEQFSFYAPEIPPTLEKRGFRNVGIDETPFSENPTLQKLVE
jgi:hypothetical protein